MWVLNEGRRVPSAPPELAPGAPLETLPDQLVVLEARASDGRRRVADGEAIMVKWDGAAGTVCPGRAALCAYELRGGESTLSPDVERERERGNLRYSECDELQLGVGSHEVLGADIATSAPRRHTSIPEANGWGVASLWWRSLRSLRVVARKRDASRAALAFAPGTELELPYVHTRVLMTLSSPDETAMCPLWVPTAADGEHPAAHGERDAKANESAQEADGSSALCEAGDAGEGEVWRGAKAKAAPVSPAAQPVPNGGGSPGAVDGVRAQDQHARLHDDTEMIVKYVHSLTGETTRERSQTDLHLVGSSGMQTYTVWNNTRPGLDSGSDYVFRMYCARGDLNDEAWQQGRHLEEPSEWALIAQR